MIHHAVLTTVAVAVLSLAVLGPPVQAHDKPSAQELADLRAIAEAGDTAAQFTLGLMYATGEGVPQDDAEAVAWHRLAAAQGNADAQYNLGLRYSIGFGVSQDAAEAVTWYSKAAEQGHAEAQTRLGLAAIEAIRAKLRALDEPADIRTSADQKLAAWVHPVAEHGHAQAQFYLGVMYATGQGVPGGLRGHQVGRAPGGGRFTGSRVRRGSWSSAVLVALDCRMAIRRSDQRPGVHAVGVGCVDLHDCRWHSAKNAGMDHPRAAAWAHCHVLARDLTIRPQHWSPSADPPLHPKGRQCTDRGGCAAQRT